MSRFSVKPAGAGMKSGAGGCLGLRLGGRRLPALFSASRRSFPPQRSRARLFLGLKPALLGSLTRRPAASFERRAESKPRALIGWENSARANQTAGLEGRGRQRPHPPLGLQQPMGERGSSLRLHKARRARTAGPEKATFRGETSAVRGVRAAESPEAA